MRTKEITQTELRINQVTIVVFLIALITSVAYNIIVSGIPTIQIAY